MKKQTLFTATIISLLLLYISNTKGGEGFVIVREAPLFAKRDKTSEVVQYVRKGDKIYIHPYAFRMGPDSDNTNMDEKSYNKIVDEEHLLKGSPDLYNDNLFYVTIDQTGKTAYILQKHVKLLYHDHREEKQNILSQKDDKTDYILPEPLPRNYPFYQKERFRVQLNAGLGEQTLPHYPYPKEINKTSYGPLISFSFQATKNIYIKKTENYNYRPRINLGGIGFFNLSRNSYELNDGSSEETWLQLGLGPLLAYDIYRSYDYRISMFGAIPLNYFLTTVRQSAPNTESETRTFNSFQFSALFGATYEHKKMFKDLDLVAGLKFEAILPHTLKSSGGSKASANFWKDDSSDQINSKLSLQSQIFVGLQSLF